MNLRLLHPSDDPSRYKRLDRANSRTNKYACHFYEWIGLYNMSVPQRLLGHYRLFQLYKAQRPRLEAGMTLTRGYILHCRNVNGLKYFLNRCFTFLNAIVTRGDTDRTTEIHGINRILLFQRTEILQDFLIDADLDFDKAFQNAKPLIDAREFLNTTIPTYTLVQIINDRSQNTLTHNEYHVQTTIYEEAPTATVTGKKKDIFSKKQILILFDLLHRSGNLERIDMNHDGKRIAVAQLLAAITDKTADSWLEELKDYKTTGLYDYNKPGEQKQLISTITNLAEKFRAAGFRTLATAADKKMVEIEMQR